MIDQVPRQFVNANYPVGGRNNWLNIPQSVLYESQHFTVFTSIRIREVHVDRGRIVCMMDALNEKCMPLQKFEHVQHMHKHVARCQFVY